jgi:hypothetical protein
MFQSIIRLVVHAVFGIGLLTAFTSFQPAEAGKIGGAIAKVAVKAAVGKTTRKSRDQANIDESSADATDATEASKTPKVLNRWDMQRRPEPSANAEATPDDDAAKTNGATPVVVTIPNDKSDKADPSMAVADFANVKSSDPCGPGQSCVVCLAGCPESRGQVMFRQQQIARKD